jgi:hypothetical protein
MSVFNSRISEADSARTRLLFAAIPAMSRTIDRGKDFTAQHISSGSQATRPRIGYSISTLTERRCKTSARFFVAEVDREGWQINQAAFIAAKTQLKLPNLSSAGGRSRIGDKQHQNQRPKLYGYSNRNSA